MVHIHLGHRLILKDKHKSSDYYICIVCGMVCYRYYFNNVYYVYYDYDNIGNSIEISLTCNEVIIKKLLE